MSQLDIMLDMITGSIKDHCSERQQDTNTSSRRIDVSDVHKFNWQQINSLNTSLLSNIIFTKLFSGRLTHKKKEKNNKTSVSGEIVPEKIKAKAFKNVMKIFSLKNSLKQNTFTNYGKKSKNDFIDDLLKFPTNVLNNSMGKEHEKDLLTSTDTKFQENLFVTGDITRHGLELFFQSILNCTKEFNEEEILDLQIQILKAVKSIKGKRDLKLNLRRYCVAASMSFNDSAKKMDGAGII